VSAAEGAKWADVVNATVTRIRDLGPYVSYREMVEKSVEEEVKNG
jgi:coenzyme F420-reducing hydrogenase delta subunit